MHRSVLRTDDTESLVRSGSYDEYGVPLDRAEMPPPKFGYRGELHLEDLLHLRARDYDPETGVFTTKDPLDGVDGEVTVANPYHYVSNSPLNQIDPLGLRPLTDSDVQVLGVKFVRCRIGFFEIICGVSFDPGPKPGTKTEEKKREEKIPPLPIPVLPDDEQDRLYRGGARTVANLTPRDPQDVQSANDGLSTFTNVVKAFGTTNTKAQVIDRDFLRILNSPFDPLFEYPDPGDPEHVILSPRNLQRLRLWASRRNASGFLQADRLTHQINLAIVGEIRRPPGR